MLPAGAVKPGERCSDEPGGAEGHGVAHDAVERDALLVVLEPDQSEGEERETIAEDEQSGLLTLCHRSIICSRGVGASARSSVVAFR
jgi:hypothetical protein